MKIINIPITDLKPYENNPRHNENAIQYVANSIEEFGFKVPIVIDDNYVIIAGHTRMKAAEQLGYETVPCIIVNDLTDVQIKAFRIADNKTAEYATWNEELLLQELLELKTESFEMIPFGFDEPATHETESEYTEEQASGALAERFLIPPFSIFDTRQGYWQDRKRMWKAYGIDSGQGRDDALLGEGLKMLADNYYGGTLTGTSIFDPVLCEIMYKWFNVIEGNIFDPFAGGCVRGIVAEKLGYKYTGIDLSEKQIDSNIEIGNSLELYPNWICDDSLNADEHVNDDSVDMIMSCPPYADLEVYSDDPKDISNMSYEQFKNAYKSIIEIACRKLKNDRFAVFVVGDVRDKKGFYRNFIDYTKQCFNENGLMTYNEIILIEQIATAAMRANGLFKNRKVVKTHQNVLVFYKGDPKNIRLHYSTIDVDEIMKGE